MDAVPVTLGQEFGGYAAQMREGGARVRDALPRVGKIHRIHQHPRARFRQQRQGRLLYDAGIDLPLAQRLQQIDAHCGELHLGGIGAGLFQQI